MRAIKFRAWDDLNKKWLLGYEYPNLGGFSMMGEVMCFGEYSKMLNSFSLKDWDKIILMQYTGLKDKNGNEIYEGDIVKFGTGIYPVEYLEKRTFSYGHGDSGEELYVGFFIGSSYGVENIPEVIGNIYENHELLTK